MCLAVLIESWSQGRLQSSVKVGGARVGWHGVVVYTIPGIEACVLQVTAVDLRPYISSSAIKVFQYRQRCGEFSNKLSVLPVSLRRRGCDYLKRPPSP